MYWDQGVLYWEQGVLNWDQGALNLEQGILYWEQGVLYWEQGVSYWEHRSMVLYIGNSSCIGVQCLALIALYLSYGVLYWEHESMVSCIGVMLEAWCLIGVMVSMVSCIGVMMPLSCIISPQVLPRQTCRLFTHNYLIDEFGNGDSAHRGREGLRGVAYGGEVFCTILYNPVSVR